MALPVMERLFGFPVLDPQDPFFDALFNGVFQAPTETRLVLLVPDGSKLVFKGDFILSGGVVTGGTMTGFVTFAGKTKVMVGDGYSIPATDLVTAINQYQSGNDDPLESLFLAIPTKYVGSDQDDLLFADTGGSKVLGKAGNDHLFGDSGNETLKGGDGNDLLVPVSGADWLYGGEGNDGFYFAALGEIHKIKDFSPDDDVISLGISGFVGVPQGFLDDTQFRIGKQAKTAEQVIVYDQKTGALYFDADGSGIALQVQFAKVSKGLALTADNFVGDITITA